jgi:UDP-apiose/xylose synthase
MKIALLGAGGFIGSHLVGHLLAEGEHELVGVDRTDEKLVEVLAGAPAAATSRWTFHRADIRYEADILEAVVRGADLVVDLIAHANPSLYVSSPLEVFDLNFVQNLDVAKRCAEYGRRLIQYSSAEVYGKAHEGVAYSEDTTDSVMGPVHKQRWIYAASKLLLERVLYAQGVAGELEYTILRPFNFIGSRIDYLVPANAIGGPRVFPHFMSALLTGGPLRLVDGGHVRRAFMHIEDANQAFQTILDHPDETRNQIYNFGNPENDLTIREVAALMIELYQELTGTAASSEVVQMSGEQFYGEGYEDSSRLPPNVDKLRSLGWRPQHDIRATFRDAMAFYLDGVRNARVVVPASEGHGVAARVGRFDTAGAVKRTGSDRRLRA